MAWNLTNLRSKVRKLSGTPSTNQLSDADLDEYIENFYLQDLMAMLNLEELDDWYYLRTYENIERYGTLPENFSLKGPAYVNGRLVSLFDDETLFFEDYPQTYQSRENVGTGDGATTNFTGTLSENPISPQNLIFDDDLEVFSPRKLEIDALTAASNAAVTTRQNHLLSTGDLVMISKISEGMLQINNRVSKITKTSNTAFTLDSVDSSSFTAYTSGGEVIPMSVVPLEGNLGGTGTATISTGAFDITFATAPASSQDIRANYEAYRAGEPDAVLWNDREVIVRPVPDATYDVKIGVSSRPRDLRDSDGNFDADATLARDDWGKFVCYGAAIDILNDRNQQEIAAALMPQFSQLKEQVMSRWIRNYRGERSVPSF